MDIKTNQNSDREFFEWLNTINPYEYSKIDFAQAAWNAALKKECNNKRKNHFDRDCDECMHDWRDCIKQVLDCKGFEKRKQNAKL